jgi:hypothetical protein
MRISGANCKIRGVNLTQISAECGGAGDLKLEVSYNLIDENGTAHAKTTRIGGWSDEVLSELAAFYTSVEKHVSTIHFKEEAENDRAESEHKGIFDSELGGS